MSHRLTRLAAAALAALVVVPATASAAPAANSKIVAKHTQKAVKATTTLEKLVAQGKDARALKSLKSARRESAKASRAARRMAARARTTRQATSAIGALAAAGALQASAASDHAELIGEADRRVQTALARSLPSTIASRDAIIASLQRLLERFDSAEVQALAAEVLAALTVQVPATVESLATLDQEKLPGNVADLVTTAMNSALGILDLVTAQLSALVPTLPTAAQGPVGNALTTVTTMLGSLQPVLEGISTTVASTVNSVMTMVTDLIGNLPFVSGFLPGAGTDTGAGSGESGSSTGGLLGGMLPNLGELPVVGGLLQSILGGLPLFGARG